MKLITINKFIKKRIISLVKIIFYGKENDWVIFIQLFLIKYVLQ